LIHHFSLTRFLSRDMESATGIISVMKQAGLEPGAETYATLLIAHAKRGEIEKIREILAECDKAEIHLIDKDHLDIVFALATNGHADQVDEILARTRKSAGFNQDAVNVILRLVHRYIKYNKALNDDLPSTSHQVAETR